MDRTQRLLSLVAMLLDARAPVPFSAIREAFRGEYGGSDEAAERKFERDKADLHELGIPLRYVSPEVDDSESEGGGYELDPSAYYLPDVGLTPEETAVLYAAGAAALQSGAFPLAADLRHALRKVSYLGRAEEAPPPIHLHADVGGPGEPVAAMLPTLWAGLSARKSITFEYRSPHRPVLETRKVDAWGLALRRGAWTLVGHCHLRGALRTFQVRRMKSVTVNAQRPRTPDYDIPADFVLDAHVAHHPWGHRFHAPLEVQVEFREALAPLWARMLPGARAEGPPEGDRQRVSLEVTYLDGLCRHVLSLSPRARVVGPESAAARFRALAEAVAARHGEVAS